MNYQFFSMRSAILSSWRPQQQSAWPRWAARLRWSGSSCNLERNCALPAHADPSVPVTCALGLIVLLGCIFEGCATAEADQRQPISLTPAAFTEQTVWREVTPHAVSTRSSWWEIFNDPVLTWLEAQAQTSTVSLEAAASRVEQAHAIAGVTGFVQYPEGNFFSGMARSGGYDLDSDRPDAVPWSVAYDINALRVARYARYELAIWKRVRRLTKPETTQTDDNHAARDTVAFTLEGEIAQTYFLIRYSDEERRILQECVELRHLVAARVEARPSSDFALARTQTQVAFARAESERASKRRADLEHSLAVLLGVPREQFYIKSLPFDLKPPVIPPAIESDMLQRRPDIADAQRVLAARNTQSGVVTATYFPSIRMTGEQGFESAEAMSLLERAGYTRLAGVSLSQPPALPFIGVEADRTNSYEGSLADYQDRILRAFQEVEDRLASLRILNQKAQHEATALARAKEAVRLAQERYRKGLARRVEIDDAQRTSLRVQRQALRVTSDRMLDTVALIKALGGGWRAGRS
jgi:multidrug efflux system outer membrane protein